MNTSQQRRTLETEATQRTLRTLEVGPAAAANEPAIPVLYPPEDDMHSGKSIAASMAVGAVLWTVVGVLVWLALR